ncbi:hypothetical protein [Demequina lutea]|uniref:Uncharacterized protein n=1 Tax=Demequina lutea TaxID=431489 RepID=A0A7Z0CIF9_9MICO|nr:hypothetical protein [Demequina lutea]NYI39928.1 hypothetical protein [Demequina lutea]
MRRTGVDDGAQASHDHAVEELVAIATGLAQGREVTVDSAIAGEARRRDAEMWASLGARGHAS